MPNTRQENLTREEYSLNYDFEINPDNYKSQKKFRLRKIPVGKQFIFIQLCQF
jgi:hypothetical protein